MADLPEWVRDMTRVVDDRLMKQIAEDFRRGPPSPGPTLPTVTPVGAGKVVDADVGPKYRPLQQGGWTTPPSIDQWKPPGLDAMDRLMDQEDLNFRAQRIKELAEAAATRRALAAAEAELLKEHEEPKPSEKK
jgi:hypothetical protein